MKYPAYPKYKESGVEWLGEIPEDWDIKKTSLLFSAKKGSSAAQLTKEYCATIEGEFPVFSGQTENDGIMALINTYEFDSGCNGFLFSTTVGAKAMSLMHVKGKFSLSQNCMVIIPLITSIDIRFYYYHMQPLFSFERGLIPEHMQASFRMEDLYAYRIALPSFSTQQIIASFLDTETAKIDGLIKDYEELITLLQEKRQALISHAVTRGLSELVSPDDPEFGEWAKPVKFKDSGVEWLGEIPEGWEVIQGRYLGNLFGSELVNEEELCESGSVAFIKVSSLSLEHDEITESEWYLDIPKHNCSGYQSNFVVFPKRGAAIFLNKVNIIGFPAILDPNLMGWSPFTITDVEFLAFLIKARGLSELADTSTVPQLNNKHILPEKFPLPDRNEQKAIVSYLKNQTSKIDSLITETESAISLLKEHRSALITNAVTGKINVEALV